MGSFESLGSNDIEAVVTPEREGGNFEQFQLEEGTFPVEYHQTPAEKPAKVFIAVSNLAKLRHTMEAEERHAREHQEKQRQNLVN
jgi:hypothetical protein